jgi:PIN domain
VPLVEAHRLRVRIAAREGWRLIIFDTNTLYGLHRNSPKFDLLRALKHSGSHSAGIPWMVREELVAQQVLEYTAAYDSAEAAVRGLDRKAPWRSGSVLLPSRGIDQAKDYWRSQYAEVLSTLETSGESAKEALAREAYCQKPAKTDAKAKGGARDVAIWLSVIDYLKENPTETVYFVSNNVRDFSDGEYPDPMLDDVGDMRDRLVLLTSFEEVISRFTQDVAVDPEKARNVLTSLPASVLASVESSAQTIPKNVRVQVNGVDNTTSFHGNSGSVHRLPSHGV